MPASPPFIWSTPEHTGLPFQTEPLDVDSLPYWSTLSGFNKDSVGDVTSEQIEESRMLAVKWWWRLHKVTFNGLCTYTSGNYGTASASLPGTPTTVTYGIDEYDEFLVPVQVETGVFSPEDRHCLNSRYFTPEGLKYNFTEVVDNDFPAGNLQAYCYGLYNSNPSTLEGVFKSFFLNGEFVGIGFSALDGSLVGSPGYSPMSVLTQVRDPEIYALATLGGSFRSSPVLGASIAYTSVTDGSDTWHGVGGAVWSGGSYGGTGTADGATMSASVSVSIPDDPEVEETDNGLEASGSVSISTTVECYT